MFAYNGELYSDDGKEEDADVIYMEYIGSIDLCVPSYKRPTKQFQCNTEMYLGAKIYTDVDGVFYILQKNGTLLKVNRL